MEMRLTWPFHVTMHSILRSNFKEYLRYKAHEEALLLRYFGRFVVIKDEAVIADYAAKNIPLSLSVFEHHFVQIRTTIKLQHIDCQLFNLRHMDCGTGYWLIGILATG